MSTYNLDATKAKEGSGRVSNRINETGAYVGMITVAEDVTAETGSKGIELTFKTNEGLEAKYLTLWTVNKDGKAIFGEKQLHALMTCLKIKTISAVPCVIQKYDMDMKKEIDVQAMIYPELMNKPVGLVLQLEEYNGRNGVAEKMVYFTAYDAATRKLAAEILDQKPAEALDKTLKSLKDKRLKPSAGNGTTSAVNQDLPNDFPF